MSPEALPTYVVTGASGGIGRAIAIGLARRGPSVQILVARGAEGLAGTAEAVQRASPGSIAEVWTSDLAELAQVRRLAASILAEHPRVRVLFNNAGAWFHRRSETSEGIERTWALNVLSPALLTELLRPALRAAAPSRVVLTASAAHRGNRLDLDDPEMRRHYRGFTAYGRSKLAIVELTAVLAERYRAERIDVNALHPGFVASGFGRNNAGAAGVMIRLLEALGGRSPESGADTALWLATAPELEGRSGGYYARRRPAAPSAAAATPGQAEELWRRVAGRLALPA